MSSSVPSILILTFNEEINIAQCLRSVAFSDDIVILDSGSTDKTLEIARTFANVRIKYRHFDTEYKQRNYGVNEIIYKHPWIYVCDADERVPPELASEILSIINDPEQPHAAYRLRYKNIYLRRWIRRATGYPTWIIRLLRHGYLTYEARETNVHPVVNGSVGQLQEHFIHYSFNAGLKRWFSKHNYYSQREAIEAAKVRKQGLRTVASNWHSTDPMLRRRALKNFSFFLRFRALWRFIFSYFLRGGWLDGKAGFHYCTMIATYEYWLELKIQECEMNWSQQTHDLARKLLVEGKS